jgi:hypothetical protein
MERLGIGASIISLQVAGMVCKAAEDKKTAEIKARKAAKGNDINKIINEYQGN